MDGFFLARGNGLALAVRAITNMSIQQSSGLNSVMVQLVGESSKYPVGPTFNDYDEAARFLARLTQAFDPATLIEGA